VTQDCQFIVQLERTVNRLRAISLDKLAQGSRVSETRQLIQEIADSALTCEGIDKRPVAALSTAALGDQLDVVGRHCAGVCDATVLDDLAAKLRELRLAL